MRKFLLAVLFALVAPFAHAQYEGISKPTPVTELFDFAVTAGGYSEACAARGGCPMPDVAMTVLEDGVGGQFTASAPTLVSVNAQALAPGSLTYNATIAHEFTHYLQWLFGKIGPNTNCEGHVKYEEEAYNVGAAYLAQFGIVENYGMQRLMLRLACAGE